MKGKIHPKKTMFFRVHVGKASNNEGSYKMATCHLSEHDDDFAKEYNGFAKQYNERKKHGISTSNSGR